WGVRNLTAVRPAPRSLCSLCVGRMVDTRFHASSGPVPLGVLLAGHAEVDLSEGAAALAIAGAEELDRAGPDQIALAAHKDYLEDLRATKAGAVIVASRLASEVP